MKLSWKYEFKMFKILNICNMWDATRTLREAWIRTGPTSSSTWCNSARNRQIRAGRIFLPCPLCCLHCHTSKQYRVDLCLQRKWNASQQQNLPIHQSILNFNNKSEKNFYQLENPNQTNPASPSNLIHSLTKTQLALSSAKPPPFLQTNPFSLPSNPPQNQTQPTSLSQLLLLD